MISAILNLIAQYAETNNIACVIQSSPAPLARERLEPDKWYIYATPTQASFSMTTRENGSWDLTIVIYFYRKKKHQSDISFPFRAVESIIASLYASNNNVNSVSIERDLEMIDINDDLFYAVLEVGNAHV